MTAIDGRTEAKPVAVTLDHAGTHRQAEVAATVHAETHGTLVSGPVTVRTEDGTWRAFIEYAPWAES